MLEQKLKAVIRDIHDFPKPGILFKDLTPILLYPSLCNEVTMHFAKVYEKQKIDAIVGVESRGFLFGPMIAQKLNIPFVPVRKKGKLPGNTVQVSYDLEYGSAIVEMQNDFLKQDMNVVIHDDLLATGGTAAASAELVKMLGANIAGFSFIVELSFLNGKTNLKKYSNNIDILVKY
jgi:adenine phosphoribosyltransferase